jgi:hypothetical protein
MPAEQSFLQWYQQLSSGEQEAFRSFLKSWLWENQPSSNSSIRFGGKQTVPATSRVIGREVKIRCPRCCNEFEFSE